MDYSNREQLLLEVIKDLTSLTYPEYNDENIKRNIYQYIKSFPILSSKDTKPGDSYLPDIIYYLLNFHNN